MQLIGEAIRHQVFGKGIVTGWDQHLLTVCFAGQEKKFVYPDAFSKYLELRNEEKQEEILSAIAQRDQQRAAREEKLEQEHARISYLRNLKITANSQAVFDVKPEQVEEVFSAWTVGTGAYLSGFSKGEPKIPEKLRPNSLCLLTSRPAGRPETERRIVGLFMVQEDFLGRECRDGQVVAHPKYRLRLSREQQPLFWSLLDDGAQKPRWGNGVMKYLDISQMEQLLYRLRAKVGKDLTPLYEYYCHLNKLEIRK